MKFFVKILNYGFFIKICLKNRLNMVYLVQNFSLIIFMKSILVHLVPPTHILAKTADYIDFQPLFSRDWDIFGTNGYLRWIRLKKLFKMSKSCFFRKNDRMDLNLAVSRSPNSRWLVRIEIFSKIHQNSMEMMLFCSEKNIE